MRADIYQAMANVEDKHWWFRGRRAIVKHILKGLDVPKSATILDAGSGTGGNLPMLSQFGQVFAMETDAGARELADKRGVVRVEEGTLPDHIPFGDQRFDLIVMSDVLEHIEQDHATLIQIGNRLSPQGKLLLTVPAFELLWSMHDVMHHHKRRYSMAPLRRLLERAGYKVIFASYINFFLFPLIALVRILDRLSGGRVIGKKADGNAELIIPSAPVNQLLKVVFASERYLMRIMRLPFGVSIVLLAQKA